MSNDGAGRSQRDALYDRTMSRSTALAAARRRRQRLLVTLPAALLVLGLTGGVLAAALSAKSQRPSHEVVPATQPSTPTNPGHHSTTTSTPTPPGASYTGLTPLSFTAVSLDHWWVLGRGNCQGDTGICWPVLETTNGGRSFSESPGPAEPFSSSMTPAIRFANSSDGYVFGPALYATTNGGSSWVAQSVPGKVVALEAVSGKAFALSCAPSSCSLYSELVGTGNWGPVSLPAQLTGYSHLAAGDGSIVVTDGVGVGAQPVSYFLSTNGGASFTRHLSPCFPGLAGRVFPAINATGVLWAACPTGMLATAFISSNDGASWTRAGAKSTSITPTCEETSSGSTCFGGFSNGLTVAPVDAKTALAWPAGTGAGLVLTTDGGNSYQRVYRGPPTMTLWWAGFSDPSRAYGIVHGQYGGQLIESTDGGTSWQPVPFRS